MRQNLNTALLLVVIALLLVLVFRPQAGRDRDLEHNPGHFMDTATGTIVLTKFSKEIKKHSKEAAKRREQQREKKWLELNCPPILRGFVIPFPDGLNKQSCIAWQERQE